MFTFLFQYKIVAKRKIFQCRIVTKGDNTSNELYNHRNVLKSLKIIKKEIGPGRIQCI